MANVDFIALLNTASAFAVLCAVISIILGSRSMLEGIKAERETARECIKSILTNPAIHIALHQRKSGMKHSELDWKQLREIYDYHAYDRKARLRQVRAAAEVVDAHLGHSRYV